MGIESANKIAGLNPSWPLGTDPRSEGDNHIRLIKAVMQADAAALSANNAWVGSNTWTNVPQTFGNSSSDQIILNPLGAGSATFSRTNFGTASINTSGQVFNAALNFTNTVSVYYRAANGGGNTVFRVVAPNGNVENQNNSYGAISDERLKRDISDASPQLADVLALRVVNFVLNDDEEELKQIGLIAQEVQAIKPGLVSEDPETGMLSVKYSVLVPILVKAVQELAAQVAAR